MIILERCPALSLKNWEKLTVAEMASTMQDMDSTGEPVTPDNLRLRGYSIADITKFGLRAANSARKRSVKQVM